MLTCFSFYFYAMIQHRGGGGEGLGEKTCQIYCNRSLGREFQNLVVAAMVAVEQRRWRQQWHQQILQTG